MRETRQEDDLPESQEGSAEEDGSANEHDEQEYRDDGAMTENLPEELLRGIEDNQVMLASAEKACAGIKHAKAHYKDPRRRQT